MEKTVNFHGPNKNAYQGGRSGCRGQKRHYCDFMPTVTQRRFGWFGTVASKPHFTPDGGRVFPPSSFFSIYSRLLGSALREPMAPSILSWGKKSSELLDLTPPGVFNLTSDF
jgi:hypothetical protein